MKLLVKYCVNKEIGYGWYGSIEEMKRKLRIKYLKKFGKYQLTHWRILKDERQTKKFAAGS